MKKQFEPFIWKEREPRFLDGVVKEHNLCSMNREICIVADSTKELTSVGKPTEVQCKRKQRYLQRSG